MDRVKKPIAAKALRSGLPFLTAQLQVTSLFLVLFGLCTTYAMPKFRLAAIQQFHYDQDNPLWQYDKRVMACTYCHEKSTGGAPWNLFGQALQAQFVTDAVQGQKNKFPQVLYDLLKAEKDSDGDGYADVLEVFAKTLPGDSASKPDKPVTEVQQEFEAAGGVAQYAPVSDKPKK